MGGDIQGVWWYCPYLQDIGNGPVQGYKNFRVNEVIIKIG